MESSDKKKKRNRGAKGRGKHIPTSEPGEHLPAPGTSMQTMEKSKEIPSQKQLSRDFEKKLQFENFSSMKKQESAPGQGKQIQEKQQKEGHEMIPQQLKTPECPKFGTSGPPGAPMQIRPPFLRQLATPQAPFQQSTPQPFPHPQQTLFLQPPSQHDWRHHATLQQVHQHVNFQQFQQATFQHDWSHQAIPQQPPHQQINPNHFYFQQNRPEHGWSHLPIAQGQPQLAHSINPQEPRPQLMNPQQVFFQPVRPQQAHPSQALTITQQPTIPEAPQSVPEPPSAMSKQMKPIGQQERQKKQYQSAREAVHSRDTAPPTSSSVSTISSEKSAVTPSTEAVKFSPYKGQGTAGEKVKYETNYVKLLLSNLRDVAYHYDVTIDPDRPKKLMKDAFEAFRLKNFPQVTMAFDRAKNAYTFEALNLPSGGLNDEITIDDHDMSRTKTFKVSIQETKDHEVNMSLLKSQDAFMKDLDKGKRALQCLEIILRMAAQGGVNVGRQYYWRPPSPILLDDVMELWQGIFHSAVFGQELLLNVDITNKGFPKGMSVLDVFKFYCRNIDGIENRELANIKRHLNGLNISYAPRGNEASRRVYKFNDFKNTARKEKFTNNDGALMTIEQYFGRILNAGLHYPNLPVLHVGPRNRNVYLPVELCTIPPGQAVMKKLTDKQTTKMIRETATSTDVRKKNILDIVHEVKFNKSPIVSNFGISVGDKFIDIDARILNAPMIEYSNRKTVLPRDGVWRNEQFIVPTTIQKWAILVLDYRANILNITNFAEQLAVAGRKVNMSISKPPAPIQIDIGRNRKNFQEEMRRWKGNVDILLVVIPSFGNAYQEIKTAAEVEYGILTQCVKCQTIDKVVQRNDQATLTNILLKMNSKLNGLNHRILSQGKMKLGVLKDGNFIVVGADVTHPSPDQRDIPSIVGVAASYDEDGFRYTGMWRIQDPRKEMIDDLATIIEEHLQFYRKERKTLPHTILYYRDGVGEGDFQRVLNLEFNAIRQGASRLDAKYKPNICFIVVQKRHHTRFFPEKKGPSVGRNNNVPPGTIVDTTIVPAMQNQFYLVAHQAIQGVAKPTKYCILVDEANIPIDELQALTYNLCHMFTRCNRSVSYVAPTYYAHLMAARGKVYVEGQRLNMKDLPKEYEKRKIKDDVAMRHPMFFV
uniref:Putative germ-line stem cell division protein hiwi/piwi n=1 Tax=Nyssomyia neivai TaxID=330878 RepID=A0A1L8DX68_9DIPT